MNEVDQNKKEASKNELNEENKLEHETEEGTQKAAKERNNEEKKQS